MCHGRVVFSGVEFLGQDVKWFWLRPEIRDVEHGLGGGEVEPGEVGIKSCLWGSKIGYWTIRCQSTHRASCRECGRVDLLPAAVEMPAPVITTTCWTSPSRIYSATAASDLSRRVSGSTDGSIGEEFWFPIFCSGPSCPFGGWESLPPADNGRDVLCRRRFELSDDFCLTSVWMVRQEELSGERLAEEA